MPSQPRVAFIGAGHWHAARHVAAILQAGAIVVGVSEQDADVAERVGRQFECPWFLDAAALLDETRPDFVFACPRHVDAPAVAHDLIERGLPFAIEKPLGLKASAIEPLVERARARGVFTAVPFINRYSPLWGEVGRLRQAGALTPLVHAHFRIINGPPQRYVRDGVGWMLDPAMSGGGALRNLGIHTADAFGWLTGEPVEVVAASVSRRLYNLPIEEFATAFLRTPSGVTAIIEAGYTHPHMREGGDSEWRVMGQGGYLIEHGGALVVSTAETTERLEAPTSADHYLRFARDTFERYGRGEPAIADIGDCWRAARVVDQIYALADS